MAEYSWPAKDKATAIGKRVKRLDGPEKAWISGLVDVVG